MLGLCSAVPTVTSGSCLHTVTWRGKRPLCVSCEISGNVALVVGISVIRTDEISVTVGYTALLEQCQKDPYGRVTGSPAVCLSINSIWSTCFMCDTHGLQRACPDVAGSVCLDRSMAGIPWVTTVLQQANQLPSQACASHP